MSWGWDGEGRDEDGEDDVEEGARRESEQGTHNAMNLPSKGLGPESYKCMCISIH